MCKLLFYETERGLWQKRGQAKRSGKPRVESCPPRERGREADLAENRQSAQQEALERPSRWGDPADRGPVAWNAAYREGTLVTESEA